MPPARMVLLVALASLGIVAGCTKATHTARSTTTTRPPVGSPANPVSPVLGAVRSGLYVKSVAIGGGFLEVTPAPSTAVAAVGAARATKLVEADTGYLGMYDFDIVGLGIVTIEQPPATTPTTSTTATTPTSQSAGSSTTTSSTVGSSSSTSSSTTTSSTLPPTTTTTLPLVPVYDKRLAWVGFAVSGQPSCAGGTPRILAVVVDAETGHDVLSITSGGCGSGAPVVSRPEALESVPWTIVGPSSTAITATIPACGRYVGWTQLETAPGSPVQVQAAVPYDPRCASGATTKVVDLVVPLGSSASSVKHAPTGLIDNLDVLP